MTSRFTCLYLHEPMHDEKLNQNYASFDDGLFTHFHCNPHNRAIWIIRQTLVMKCHPKPRAMTNLYKAFLGMCLGSCLNLSTHLRG